MDSRWKTFGLLIVGIALLINPFVAGVHLGTGTVHEYEAVSVEYERGEGLDLRDVQDGQRLEPLSVDDEIACEGRSDQWMCRVALFVERNGSVPGYASGGLRFHSDYEFVFLGDRFYRPTTIERGGRARLALEPVNDSDPLREVATTDLTSLEQETIESGRVVTYRRLSREHQLLRLDDGYYFVRRTARKHYTHGYDNCHSTGDGFCDAADWKRRIDTAITLASRIGGLVLLFLGWERTRR